MKKLTLSSKWILFIIFTSNLMFMAFSTLVYPVLAADKSKSDSDSSISDGIHKSSNTTTGHTKGHNQIEGVKILRVHTKPPTVHVGDKFNIEGIVINNSNDTITFPNGTCNSPISLDFDKNVLTENQGIALCTTPTKEVILKPHQQSAILTTNNSGIVYKAITPGMTNATILLNFGVETTSGKSPVSDNISRVYTFNITNKRPSTTITTHPTTAHTHIRGIKVLQVQTMPPAIAIGDNFRLRAVVINNSSSTIAFSNGTCSNAMHISFNRSVSNPANSCAVTPQSRSLSLKPGEQSFVVSGVSYKAITPGMTNATIVFDYQVKTANSTLTTEDNTTRTYAFNIYKTISTGVSASNSATHYHIKGIKVLHVHSIQSKVYVGSTLSLRGTVVNNSTSTITFENGTCTSPLSVTFNKNVLIKHHPLNASCKAQVVTLKRGEQLPIVSPNSPDISYKAIAPGMTNATMLFKYKVLTPTNKSPIDDNTTRTYSFNIQPTKTSVTATAIASPIKIKP